MLTCPWPEPSACWLDGSLDSVHCSFAYQCWMFLNVCMYVFQTECLQLDCIVGRTMLLEEPRLSHVVTCSFYLFCTCLPSSSDDSASCGKPSHCPVTCSHDTLELLSDGLCCVITCPPEDRGLCLPDLGCGCSFWPNSCLGECSWNE